MLPFIISGCQKEERALTEQEKRGKTIYVTNCTSCHNPNPRLPGPLGPELAGSSSQLIHARLMKKEYPPGYIPKRKTNLMPALPFLEKEVEALTAYLASFVKQ